MNALRQLKHRKQGVAWGGEQSKKTYEQSIEKLVASAKHEDAGIAQLRMKFKHSALGRDLQEAGHITGSREWAGGRTPSRIPRI